MNILVLVKPVPNPEKYDEILIDPITKRINREGVSMVINPEDKNALEAALQIGGNITAVAMAPKEGREKLVECLAMGVDEAYLLCDKDYGGADTYATSYVLAEAIKRMKTHQKPLQNQSQSQPEVKTFDLILAGNSSADGATSHVPVQVAEWLGIPHISGVCSIDTEDNQIRVIKKSEDTLLTFEGKGPAVIAVTRETNKPRLISAMGIIKARKKPLTIWSNEDLKLDKNRIGIVGSPTQPGNLTSPSLVRESKPLAHDAEEAAKAILQIIRRAGV